MTASSRPNPAPPRLTSIDAEALRRAAASPSDAGSNDVAAAADDLAAAFADDPMMNWLLRTDARRAAARRRLFRMILAGVALPTGRVTRPSIGGAAAVWLPSESLTIPSWREDLRGAPALLAVTGWARLGRLLAVQRATRRHHPMGQPHLYLWFLGVRPEAQGHGVGSKLLAAGLAAADAQGRPVFLESSNAANLPLYLRHGFEVVEQYRPVHGAPPLWAMWRAPPV